MSNQLAFHNHKFNTVTRNNQPWLTATQIGLALGYANPETAVTKVYNRNADEFTLAMSLVVKLTTNGGQQEARIFSLRGAHLIAMFARTPVAKEFRRWVLDILDREVGEPQRTPQAKNRLRPPAYRYAITLTYRDTLTGQEETLTGGCNTPEEIVRGTAKKFGYHIPELERLPVNAYY